MSRRGNKKGVNWNVERRYEFIEFRLYWQGNINRSDLMEAFGISVQQASKDLTNYIEGRKSNLTYDKRLRTYLRGTNFRPRYFQPDAAEYFAQLQAVEHDLVAEKQSWISFFPGYAVTPIPARGVDPEVLREVLLAIREKSALQITYQSMSGPEPTARWIAPHAIGFDGFRWQTRAFCKTDEVFKNFLLSRTLQTHGVEASGVTDEADADWQEHVTLEIAPHPELSENQKKVIALDYGMRDGRAKIKVRRALLYYALKRLGLDTDPGARKPQDQQIVLLNPDITPGIYNE